MLSSPSTVLRSDSTFRSMLQQVYGWMAAGLALTGLVAWYVSQSETLLALIFGQQLVFFGLILAQLGLVMGLSWGLSRMSAAVATGGFILYSAISGVTLAAIFLVSLAP